MVPPSHRREVVRHLRSSCDVSERRARRATGFTRSSQRHRSVADPQIELRLRVRKLAADAASAPWRGQPGRHANQPRAGMSGVTTL